MKRNQVSNNLITAMPTFSTLHLQSTTVYHICGQCPTKYEKMASPHFAKVIGAFIHHDYKQASSSSHVA